MIAIPIYFVLGWILKRLILDSKIRNITLILGTIVLPPILYGGVFILFFSFLFYEPQYDFNKEKWFAEKSSRFEMRDDIVESKILIGKSKSEIINLIGNPENNNSPNVWTYSLGMSSAGLGWLSISLQLNFKNGKVASVKEIEIVD